MSSEKGLGPPVWAEFDYLPFTMAWRVGRVGSAYRFTTARPRISSWSAEEREASGI
ncbi:hypothetical protein SUDANB96_00016 [Streptomyces sp. enrichment culture]